VDGDLDVAIVTQSGQEGRSEDQSSLSTFANRGEGIFEPASVITLHFARPSAVVAVDLDEDGIPDLAWTGRSELRVHYDPWRSRRQRSHYGLGGHAEGGALAVDFDGDGLPDLVTASPADGTIALHQSLGAFQYGGVRLGFPAREPAVLASADLDGDGREEVISAGREGGVAVLEADAAGRLAVHRELEAPPWPAVLEVADLDGDGDLDVAIACDLGSDGLPDPVAILWNAGDGSFAPPAVVPVLPFLFPTSLVAADFDADGRADLAIAGRTAGPHWLRSTAGGSFEAAESLGDDLAEYFALAAADPDGDGLVDLILGSPTEMRMLWNRGGVFERGEQLHETGASLIRLLDLDGDGALDLLHLGWEGCFRRTTCALYVHWGSANGEGVRCSFLPQVPGFTPPADLDGDGHLDLVGLRSPLSLRGALLELFSGHTSAPAPDRNRNRIPDECERAPFRRGDATGDGRLDITDPAGILGHLFRVWPEPSCLEAADANADRKLDITDAIHLLLYLFRGGPPPPPPGPPPAPCGRAVERPVNVEGLGCREYTACA
jgi:hypothetical protein